MMWSLRQARHAAGAVRRAEYGRQALDAVRPRSGLGLVRSRAPLALLLYLASRDGLVVGRPDAAFAMLRPPPGRVALAAGGPKLRLLRLIDRRFDMFVYVGPSALALCGAVVAVLGALRFGWGSPAVVAALALPVAASAWVVMFMSAQLLYAFAGAIRSRRARPGQAAAQSLPAYHWSLPLLHQPEEAQVGELLEAVSARLVALVRERVRADAEAAGARTPKVDVVETLVCLTRGITTEPARKAVARHQQTVVPYPHGDVVILLSPGRLWQLPRHAKVGGAFVFLYLSALAVVTVLEAVVVASVESAACAPASCAGRPHTFALALRWLAQRLLLTDAPNLSPATAAAVAIGWLTSLASLVAVVVAAFAMRAQFARDREQKQIYQAALDGVLAGTRVLVLVVTTAERDAVLSSVRSANGQPPRPRFQDERTIFSLGQLAGAEILLAQAGEQGTSSTAAMTATTREAIEACQPDYVIGVGICYGLRPEGGEQQIGDILISRRIQNVDHRKVSDRPGTPPVITRGVNVGCSPLLLDRCNAAQVSWPGERARIHFGTILSSNTLVDSRELVRELREQFPDAIGGEMEGVGIYEAAGVDKRLDWVVVKAISDWGYSKTKDHQAAAAANAADFVTHMIGLGALARRPAGPS